MVNVTARSQLNGKQQRFVVAYLGDASGNATKAARIAGYADPNAYGSRLMASPPVRAAIEAGMREMAMGPAEVLARLATIARGDMDDFTSVDADTGKTVIDLEKARLLGKMGLVRELSITPNGPRLKLESKTEALALLGRRYGLFVDRVEVDVRRDEATIQTELREKLATVAKRLAERDRDKLDGPAALPGPVTG